MNDDLFSLFAYNRWANDRILETARKLSPEQFAQEPVAGWTSVRATLVHIADATLFWASRFRGETATARLADTDALTIDDVARLFAQAQDAFDQILPALTPDRLAGDWSYRNRQGQEVTTPLWAALRHVVNHATYHRGQAASKLKRLGIDPPATDLVFWAIAQTAQ